MFRVLKVQAILFLTIFFSSCATGTTKGGNLDSEIRTDSWVLPLLEGYRASFKNGIYDIYKKNSKGILQLSSRVKKSDISDAEFLDLVNVQVGNRAELKNITKDDIRGYNAMFREGHVVWSYWFFVIDRSLIFVTYNVDGNKFNQEEVLDNLKMIDGLLRIK